MSAVKKVAIGGNTFTIRRFAPWDGLEILGDLQMQFIAPAMGVVDGKEAGSDMKFMAQAMDGVANVLRGLPGKRAVELGKMLINPELVVVEIGRDGSKLNDVAMQQADMTVGDVLELCIEIVMHNYADFWPRIVARFGPALSQMAKRLDGSDRTSLPNS